MGDETPPAYCAFTPHHHTYRVLMWFGSRGCYGRSTSPDAGRLTKRFLTGQGRCIPDLPDTFHDGSSCRQTFLLCLPGRDGLPALDDTTYRTTFHPTLVPRTTTFPPLLPRPHSPPTRRDRRTFRTGCVLAALRFVSHCVNFSGRIPTGGYLQTDVSVWDLAHRYTPLLSGPYLPHRTPIPRTTPRCTPLERTTTLRHLPRWANLDGRLVLAFGYTHLRYTMVFLPRTTDASRHCDFLDGNN